MKLATFFNSNVGFETAKAVRRLAQNLRDDPYRFHQITIVRKNAATSNCLESVQQEMGGEIDVTSLFFNFNDLHNIGPWLRKRRTRAKFRWLDQPANFSDRRKLPIWIEISGTVRSASR